jgi:hypothetical protein
MLRRERIEEDGSITTFEIADFPGDGPFHAEIRVSSIAELQALLADGKLIAVRMRGKPKGKVSQTNLAPVGEITGW